MSNDKNPKMDWQQVVLNGGPPCFAQLDDEADYYCGRAERWAGHDGEHKFVSLDDLIATIRREERRATFDESAESIVNEAGKVGQLMNLAAASARKEERATVKSMLEDYFKHFFCTCHGSTRTGGHFASCPTTIRDEVLGRLAGLEANETREDGDDDG